MSIKLASKEPELASKEPELASKEPELQVKHQNWRVKSPNWRVKSLNWRVKHQNSRVKSPNSRIRRPGLRITAVFLPMKHSKAYKLTVLSSFFIYVPMKPYLFSANRRIKVAKGPKNKESKNQFNAVLFLPCASPAFMRASVPHPTK
ncbi:hypothetical protein [Peribacillus muralis]|uniref:hypothetical protein n=1 Tax=Peribacillus muralis TaxID=264697 RepID=UPI00380AA1F9